MSFVREFQRSYPPFKTIHASILLVSPILISAQAERRAENNRRDSSQLTTNRERATMCYPMR